MAGSRSRFAAGFRLSQPTFYTELDGRRPKRLIIKVLGE
jgi:hypothetical protein